MSLIVSDSVETVKVEKRGKRGPPKGSSWAKSDVYKHAQARRMYLVDGWSGARITKELDVPENTMNAWVRKGGWAQLRQAAQDKALNDVVSEMNAECAKIYADLAVGCEELSVGSLERAREALAAGESKDLSMVSTALRNFTDIARRIRALDRDQLVRVNVAFANTEKPMRNVTQPIETAAQGSIEVNASPVPHSCAP